MMFKVYAEPTSNANNQSARSTRNQKAGGQAFSPTNTGGRGYRGNRTGAGRPRA